MFKNSMDSHLFLKSKIAEWVRADQAIGYEINPF